MADADNVHFRNAVITDLSILYCIIKSFPSINICLSFSNNDENIEKINRYKYPVRTDNLDLDDEVKAKCNYA